MKNDKGARDRAVIFGLHHGVGNRLGRGKDLLVSGTVPFWYAKMQSRFRDWGDVRVFLEVMREGSTLAAYRHVGINQTTFARRIDVLEHTFDVTLFDRTTRGAVPTEHATALLPYAEGLKQAAYAFEAEAEKGRASEPIWTIAFENEMFGNIGTIVAEFVAEHHGVSFEFIFSERNLDLMNGEADVALRMVPAISDDRLIAQKVGQTHWTCYASHAYAANTTLPTEFARIWKTTVSTC